MEDYNSMNIRLRRTQTVDGRWDSRAGGGLPHAAAEWGMRNENCCAGRRYFHGAGRLFGNGSQRVPRSEGKRSQGHFVDLFLGLEQVPDPLEALFDAPDGLCPDVKISAVAPDLEAVRRSRADQSARLFGPHVLEVCALADLVFWAFTGKTGKMAAFRQPLTCWESGIPAAGTWEAVWLWTNPLLR